MKKRVIVLVIPTIVFFSYWLLVHPKEFELFLYDANVSSMHFNILSVAAVIAGFMFTTFGILVSIADNEVVRKLRKTSIIDKKSSTILTGLIYNLIAIFCALVFVLHLDSFVVGRFVSFLRFIVCLELVALVEGIIYLAVSVKIMYFLLKLVMDSKPDIPDEVIERVKSRIYDEGDK